jgi:Raf kinase inhibitor-like YbhB/YbcL family protein
MSASTPPFPYNTYDSLPPAPLFELTSTDISEGGTMPAPQLSKAFGVEGGEDKSPQLSWSGFPEGTKSFVVSCYDPDAPTVSGFWHWVMYDVPASVTKMDSGAPPPPGAKLLKNDAGFAGFCGAAPPPGHGQHRYIFCVSALGVENLPIDEHTSPAVCNFNMFGAGVLGRAFLTATFGR